MHARASDRAGERQCGDRGAPSLAGCGNVGKVRARRERLSEGVIELSIVSPELFSIVSPEFVADLLGHRPGGADKSQEVVGVVGEGEGGGGGGGAELVDEVHARGV